MSMDKVFRERESLNVSIVDSINKASEAWGISCLRYEIRDIKVCIQNIFSMSYVYINYIKKILKLPSRVHEAMQMQVEAERKKRAAILESEGIREADINVAEGKRQARILGSGIFIINFSITLGIKLKNVLLVLFFAEAQRMEQINHANGEASAMLAIADARAKGLEIVSKSLSLQVTKNRL